MTTVYCHLCGGVILRPATIEYRPPRASAQLAAPHESPCRCAPPIVYEEPPGLGPATDSDSALAHQNLVAAVRAARDRVRELSGFLASEEDPQAGASNALHLALGSLQKRLLSGDPEPQALASLVPELEQLTAHCAGKLAPVRPLLDTVLRIARSTPT